MADTPNTLFPEKQYRIGNELLTIRPLSFYEMMVTLPGVVGRIFEKAADEDAQITAARIIEKAGAEVLLLLNVVSGKGLATSGVMENDFWKAVPIDKGLEIMADFLEINISENFMSALTRAVQAAKQIGLRLSSSLLSTDTQSTTSGDTQKGK